MNEKSWQEVNQELVNHSVMLKQFLVSFPFKHKVHFGVLFSRLSRNEKVTSVPTKAFDCLVQVPEALDLLRKAFPGQLADVLACEVLLTELRPSPRCKEQA